MLAAWPGLERALEGAWQARFAHGFTRRANSVACLDPDDETKPAQRIETFAARFRAKGLRPVFRVTPLTGTSTYQALIDKGWQGEAQSLVLEAQPSRSAGHHREVAVLDVTDRRFVDAQRVLKSYSAQEAEIFRAILANIRVPAKGLLLSDADGTPRASALCALGYGTGVVLNVVTDPDMRRRGLARRIMESAMAWLAESGARRFCLQVEADNRPAIALYLSMGFAYRYPYHYRVERT